MTVSVRKSRLLSGVTAPVKVRQYIGLLAFLVVAFAAARVQAANFDKEPHLFYMGNTATMKVVWQADGTPGSQTLEWGLDTGYGMGSPGGTLAEDKIYSKNAKRLVVPGSGRDAETRIS